MNRQLARLAPLLLAAPAWASDIVVAPGGSIQSAIVAATSGDRVLVQPGVYVEQIDLLGKSIEVIGMRGPTLTTIDGGGAAPVVRFVNGEGPSVRLLGFTITNGHTSSGAGGVAVAAGATPRIEDCIIRNNSGRFGGGLSGSPRMRRCIVAHNTASLTHGGGIYGAPDMSQCVVASNSCTSATGGGLYVTGGSPTIEDCLFLGNSAVLAGGKAGGVYIHANATAVIRRSVIADNFATGGAFSALGGGVLCASSTSLLEGCTIVDNHLTGSSVLGGGLYGPATLVNTIVRGNTAPQLGAAGPISYCDVEGGAAGAGNFDLDPLLVAAGVDAHLRSGSPCIDAGDPTRFDADGSRSDVGAYPFATLYTRPNGEPSDWSHPNWAEISSVIGGHQTLRLLPDGAYAGLPFQTLGSLSGVTPGANWMGIPVPLNFDRYFRFTTILPNLRWLSNSAGALNGLGEAETVFTIKPGGAAPLGATHVDHAMLVFPASGTGALLVTNPVGLDVAP